jgi:hypothetical protein
LLILLEVDVEIEVAVLENCVISTEDGDLILSSCSLLFICSIKTLPLI